MAAASFVMTVRPANGEQAGSRHTEALMAAEAFTRILYPSQPLLQGRALKTACRLGCTVCRIHDDGTGAEMMVVCKREALMVVGQHA